VTAISTDLCVHFTRREKAKGRPKRGTVCAVCDGTYPNHYPAAGVEAQPKLAFPIMPTQCLHFTKLDGKRGKPSPKSFCAVCERRYDHHHPRGEVYPVKHGERVLAHQIGLTPKTGSLVKTGVDTPTLIEAVAVIETPPEPAQEPETVEVEPEVETIIETPPEPAQEPETVEVEPEVETIIEPPVEAFAEPEESETKPTINRLALWMQQQEEEEIEALMAQGMSREEAQAHYDEENDW
jgi:hypothetical protein